MIKLSYSKRLFKRISSTSNKQQAAASGGGGDNGSAAAAGGGGAREIEWEVRPGGMLVQKRDGRGGRETVAVRVSTGFSWHDVSIGATSTFGEQSTLFSPFLFLFLSLFDEWLSFAVAGGLAALVVRFLGTWFHMVPSWNFPSFYTELSSPALHPCVGENKMCVGNVQFFFPHPILLVSECRVVRSWLLVVECS